MTLSAAAFHEPGKALAGALHGGIAALGRYVSHLADPDHNNGLAALALVLGAMCFIIAGRLMNKADSSRRDR
jgi:hypothetical protein